MALRLWETENSSSSYHKARKVLQEINHCTPLRVHAPFRCYLHCPTTENRTMKSRPPWESEHLHRARSCSWERHWFECLQNEVVNGLILALKVTEIFWDFVDLFASSLIVDLWEHKVTFTQCLLQKILTKSTYVQDGTQILFNEYFIFDIFILFSYHFIFDRIECVCR